MFKALYKLKGFLKNFRKTSSIFCIFKHLDGVWNTGIYFHDTGCTMSLQCPRCFKVLQKQDVDDSMLYDRGSVYVWNKDMIKDYGVDKKTFNRLQRAIK